MNLLCKLFGHKAFYRKDYLRLNSKYVTLSYMCCWRCGAALSEKREFPSNREEFLKNVNRDAGVESFYSALTGFVYINNMKEERFETEREALRAALEDRDLGVNKNQKIVRLYYSLTASEPITYRHIDYFDEEIEDIWNKRNSNLK